MAVKLSNPGTIYVKNIQKAMLNSSKCILSGKLIVYQNGQIQPYSKKDYSQYLP